jgi:hypothetical protein
LDRLLNDYEKHAILDFVGPFLFGFGVRNCRLWETHRPGWEESNRNWVGFASDRFGGCLGAECENGDGFGRE